MMNILDAEKMLRTSPAAIMAAMRPAQSRVEYRWISQVIPGARDGIVQWLLSDRV